MNRSYCRFENTYHDLLDCEKHLDDEDLDDVELNYKLQLIELCKNIANDHRYD